jgi:hypothetical protein
VGIIGLTPWPPYFRATELHEHWTGYMQPAGFLCCYVFGKFDICLMLHFKNIEIINSFIRNGRINLVIGICNWKM